MLDVASSIDSVRVFRVGARVTRVADVARPAGGYPAEVRFPGLPLCLDDASVRVCVVAPDGLRDGGALPVAADVRLALDVGPAAAAPELDAVLRDARAAATAQAELLEQLGSELAQLDALQVLPRDRAAPDAALPPTPHAARRALLAVCAEHTARLRMETLAAQAELAERQRRVRELENRVATASSARPARADELRKVAIVRLRDGTSAKARLLLEYLVPGARWLPTYVARIDTRAGAVTLEQRAYVAQRSGEDWRGVSLSLVTADAVTFAELPQLASLRIGRRQTPPSTGWRPVPAGADALFAGFDAVPRLHAVPPPPPPEPVACAAPAESEYEESVAMCSDAPQGIPSPKVMASLAPPAPGAMPMRAAFGGEAKKRRMAKDTARADDDYDESALRSEAPVEAEPAPLTADAALLDYGRLRLVAADAARRGRLVAETEVGVAESPAVREACGEARSRAQHLLAPAPPGHGGTFPDDYDYSYPAATRVDLLADGAYHNVPLAQARDACAIDHVVVPRVALDVFRIAALAQPFTTPILAGPIDVYLDGDFLLTSSVPFTPPGARLRFALGVEQAIKVVRNTAFREESSGLLGGSLALHHQLRLTITNHAPRAVAVEVRERVPVRREGEEQLEITVGAVQPPWQPYAPVEGDFGAPDLRGGYVWRLQLGVGANQALAADYTVKIASKSELVGGNRREA